MDLIDGLEVFNFEIAATVTKEYNTTVVVTVNAYIHIPHLLQPMNIILSVYT